MARCAAVVTSTFTEMPAGPLGLSRRRQHTGGVALTSGSAADFLIRTVLDDAFRDLAMADPRRAFEGYDLSLEEQDILSSRDERLLGLLGQAAGNTGPQVTPPVKASPEDTPPAAAPVLPDVVLLLCLEPQTAQLPDSTAKVVYAASLHPWSGDVSSPPVDAELTWLVRITPTVIEAQQAGLKVAYAASIQPFTGGAGEHVQPSSGPASAPAMTPWRHNLESPAAKAAAQAVLASEAPNRYQKLLELIRALQTGG